MRWSSLAGRPFIAVAALVCVGGCVAGDVDDHVGIDSSPVIAYGAQQTITTTPTETRHHVAAVLVNGVAGTKYRLRSKIHLHGNTHKSYVQAFTYCHDEDGSTVELLTHQQNILAPNGSLTLYPRLVWEAPRTGGYTCYAAFDILGEGNPGAVLLSDQSYVENSGPLHPSSQDVREPIHHLLIGNHDADVAVDDDFTIPDLNKQIAISGDVLWTLCQPSDDGPDEPPCPGTSGSIGNLRYTVAVFQRGPWGQEYCHEWTDTKTASIGSDVHHATSYGGGTFVPNPSCGTSARLKIFVKNIGTDPIGIHKRGTILAAIPAP